MQRRRSRQVRLAPYVFVAPYLFFLVAFALAPVVYAIYISFTSRERMTGVRTFGTLESWSEALTDRDLLPAATRVAQYLVLWLPVLVLIVVVLALLSQARPGRFSTVMRFTWYLPGAVTGSAAAVLWLFMLAPGGSPFGPLLRAFGFRTLNETVTQDSLPVVLTVIGIAITAGGWIVVLHAALMALPNEVIEAARIDGAGSLRLAWNVKLPMVRKYLVLMSVASFAYGTQLFVEPQVLRSAFNAQISSTWSINQLAYSFAARDGDFAKAAALSLLLMVVGIVIALVVIYRTDFYAIDAEDR